MNEFWIEYFIWQLQLNEYWIEYFNKYSVFNSVFSEYCQFHPNHLSPFQFWFFLIIVGAERARPESRDSLKSELNRTDWGGEGVWRFECVNHTDYKTFTFSYKATKAQCKRQLFVHKTRSLSFSTSARLGFLISALYGGRVQLLRMWNVTWGGDAGEKVTPVFHHHSFTIR